MNDLDAPTLLNPQLTKQVLEEYKFLRVELEAIWNQTYTTLNFMLAVIGLIAAAGFNSKGEPLVTLPVASLITIGGYSLVRIHTTRVWRIVGYMRCALEPKLPGIRWETRLWARRRACSDPKFDGDIFDGHVFILHIVNVAILLAVTATGVHDFIASRTKTTILWTALAAVVPVVILALTISRQKRYRRGESVEEEHIHSWTCGSKEDPKIPVYVVEPPLEWKAPPIAS